MKAEDDKTTRDTYELDREAWNLPRPVKRPQTRSSVQSEREDDHESEPEAA